MCVCIYIHIYNYSHVKGEESKCVRRELKREKYVVGDERQNGKT